MIMVKVQGCSYNENNAYCNDDDSNNVIIMMKEWLIQFLCSFVRRKTFSGSISSPNAFIGRKITKGKMFSSILHVQSVIVIRVLERNSRVLSIQPKIRQISVGISKGTDRFSFVLPEYSWPALKVVHFDRSGHFGPKYPFPFEKLSSPVPFVCILLTRTKAKRAVAWVGSVQPECTISLDMWNFRKFKPEFLFNGKRPQTPQ